MCLGLGVSLGLCLGLILGLFRNLCLYLVFIYRNEPSPRRATSATTTGDIGDNDWRHRRHPAESATSATGDNDGRHRRVFGVSTAGLRRNFVNFARASFPSVRPPVSCCPFPRIIGLIQLFWSGRWVVGSEQWVVGSGWWVVANCHSHCPPPTAHCPPPTAHCPLHPSKRRQLFFTRARKSHGKRHGTYQVNATARSRDLMPPFEFLLRFFMNG